MENFKSFPNAKTPSYFALKDFFEITQKHKEFLKNEGDANGETVRFCFHKSPNDSLHVMLIYHPYKKLIPEQIFKNTDSYYLILEGKISLTNLETKERIILDKKNFLGKVGSNIPYQMEIISENVLFIEIRERNTKEKL
ncbi:hypothetical protein [Helicobacter sp. 11-8110]|uniref:hypothetical protein n=1 Tax=Helicobacter sp. 11-8110 TaxID=2004997 RepID=UPI000DCDD1BF|nr:hypothetical protein [Helicobacter sp. 11-8110]RAX52300.1 hypothetical protein CCY98_04820 [Helicobacter sp. 11-8110]